MSRTRSGGQFSVRWRIATCLIVFLSGLLTSARPAWPSDSPPVLNLPFVLSWNIAPKDSSVTQVFKVKKDRTYRFDLTFKCADCTLQELKSFVGQGAFRRLTKDSAGTDRPIVVPEHTHEEEEFLKSGGVLVGGLSGMGRTLPEKFRITWLAPPATVTEMVPDGVIIPVHLEIERLDSSAAATVITDQVHETTGFIAGGQHGLVREITYVRLKPGKYRLIARTTMETPVPRDVETMFEGTWYAHK